MHDLLYRRLFSIALSFTLGNEDDAREVVSSFMAKCMINKKLGDKFGEEGASYLLRAFRNHILDWLRVLKRRKEVFSLDLDSFSSNSRILSSTEDDFERYRLMFLEMICELKERDRLILFLCYHGLGNKKSAKVLNMSVDNFKSTKSYLKRKLKNLV